MVAPEHIDNFIVRLRRYIEDEATRPKHLQTVRGVGYKFVADPDTAKARQLADRVHP